MHDTAYRIGGLVMDTYLPSVSARILEIGAQNVNGSLRDHSPRNAEYIGLDVVAGEGVDVVVNGAGDWNVSDAYFDLVMASSVFEHDKAFWRTFIEMCKKVKPGGHIYISAPSNGLVHRFPKDYWRFYPDSGLALEDLARSEGFDLTLIESFIAERDADLWNDFCAVFQRGPCNVELNRDFVHNKVRCTNALNWRSSLIINTAEDSEDMRLLRQARDEALKANALRDSFEIQLSELALQKEKTEGHLQGRVDELTQLIQERELHIEEQGLQLHAVTAELEKERTASSEQQRSFEGRVADLVAQRAAGEDDVNKRHREISELTEFIQKRDQHVEEQGRQLQALTACLAKERADFAARQRASDVRLAEVTTQKAASEDRLQERFREISELTLRVRKREADLDEQSKQLQALNAALEVKRADSVAMQRSFEAQFAELTAQQATSEDRLQERFREIGELTLLLQEREQHLDGQGKQLQALTAALEKEQAHSTELGAQKTAHEERLNERFREIHGLTRLIQERDRHISNMQTQVEWLRRVISVLTKGFSTSGKARILAWLPAYFSQKWQKASLREQGLFDSSDYVANYPDVLSGKADPLRHYINHGIREGRVINKEVGL